MKKNQVKDLWKVAGVTALTLAIVTSSFLGANVLAFAAATQPQQLSPVAAQVSPDTKAADNALQAEYQKPALTVIWDQGLDENGVPYPTRIPGADALSPEEAAQIGAQYIWDMTGESIDGKVVEMLYGTWPSHSRSYWEGTVVDSEEDLVKEYPESLLGFEDKTQYSFMVDAVTGDRVAIHPYPDIVSSDLGEGKIVTLTPVQLEAMQYQAPPDVEEYVEFAREYAQKHFNHSKVTSVDFASLSFRTKDGEYTDAWQAGKDVPYPFTIYDKGRTITFEVMDDTGRVATMDIYMDTKQVFSLDSMDSDFIPGYYFEVPGAVAE